MLTDHPACRLLRPLQHAQVGDSEPTVFGQFVLHRRGGTSHSRLAEQYGVHPSTIGAILKGKRWSE